MCWKEILTWATCRSYGAKNVVSRVATNMPPLRGSNGLRSGHPPHPQLNSSRIEVWGQLHRSAIRHISLTQALAELFGAEGPDAVEAKAEDDLVLFADAYVEGVVLKGDRAAIVGVADGD